MTTLFAIDPGSSESGWVLYRRGEIIDSGIGDNHDMLPWIRHGQGADKLVIEMAESFGQKVWSQVFTTVRWTGRFQQAWRAPEEVGFITRSQVKMHLCGRRAADDSMIRQALLKRLGPPGTKKAPGPTYGVTSHAWAALAVAVTAERLAQDAALRTLPALAKPSSLEVA